MNTSQQLALATSIVLTLLCLYRQHRISQQNRMISSWCTKNADREIMLRRRVDRLTGFTTTKDPAVELAEERAANGDRP